jgi:hypothetical protein
MAHPVICSSHVCFGSITVLDEPLQTLTHPYCRAVAHPEEGRLRSGGNAAGGGQPERLRCALQQRRASAFR